MDNQLDKLAREEIKNREIKPRSSVWDQLEAQLDQEQTPKKNGKNNPIILLSILLVIALLGFFQWINREEFKNISDSESVQMVAPTAENKTPSKEVKKVNKLSVTDPIPEAKPAILNTKIFNPTPKIEIKGIQTKEDKSQIQHNVVVPTAQPIASTIPVAETPSKIAEVHQNVAVVQKPHSSRFDATKLLEEANADLSKNSSKYNIDPASLLKSAEKDSRDQFFNRVVKTLAETSTNVYAMVNNRNVEP